MKNSKFLTLALVPLMMLASCSCGSHTHAASTEWANNETHHWHACSGCDEHLDEAEHTYGIWAKGSTEHWANCTECGYLYKTAHVFDKEVVDDKYLASAATCTTAATYYYSCVCGAKGTTTFSLGEAAGHNPKTAWEHDETYHWHECEDCDEKVNKAEHVYDKKVISTATLASTATCNEHAKYYYSCVCGAISSTLTFVDEDSELLSHTAGTTFYHDEDGHWNLCTKCGEKTNVEAHTMVYKSTLAGSSEFNTIIEKCSVCGFEKTYSIEDGKGYEVVCSKVPSYDVAGQLTFTPQETGKEAFTISLPSFGEDLAKDEDERIYDYYEEYDGKTIGYASGTTILKCYGDDALSFARKYGYTSDEDAALIACSITTKLQENSWHYENKAVRGSDFLFLVQDIFTITGRGTVVSGEVISGKIKINDPIDIYHCVDGSVLDSAVTGIEYLKQGLDEAVAGQTVGITLRGIAKSQLSAGDAIVSDGYSLKQHNKFVGEFRLFSKNEGGRKNVILTGYRPQFDNGATSFTGVMSFDEDKIYPGEFYEPITVELLTHMFVYEGMVLPVKESGHTVGTFVVTGLIEEGSTYLYNNQSDWGAIYSLCFNDVTENGFYVELGADGIELSESDTDAGSYLPSFVYNGVYNSGKEIIVNIWVLDEEDAQLILFTYDSQGGVGWVDRDNGVTTLRLECAVTDAPYGDDMGYWNYTATDELEVFVTIYVND